MRRGYLLPIYSVLLAVVVFCASAAQAQIIWLSQDRHVATHLVATPTAYGLSVGATPYTSDHVASAPDFGRFVREEYGGAYQDSSIGENQIVAKGHGDYVEEGHNQYYTEEYMDSFASVTFHVSEPMQWNLQINRLDQSDNGFFRAYISLKNDTSGWFWAPDRWSAYPSGKWFPEIGPETSGVLQPGDWTFKASAAHADCMAGEANYDVVLSMQAVPEPAGLCGLLLAAPLLLARRRAV